MALNQSYTYNHIGQLTSVRDNLSSKDVALYTYDGAGNISTKTLANGVTTAYTYNGTNSLSSVTNKKGNTVLSSYAYTYYLDGNRASVTDQSGNIHSYTYDKLGQLKSETDTKNGTMTSYTYDGNGNRITKDVSGGTSSSTQYTYDANNRLTKESCNDTISVTEHDYYYDNNGNLITKTVSMYTEDTGEFEQLSIDQYPLGYMSTVDGALATSYGYNLRNMLTSIETDTGLQTEYLYDASGARAKKTVNGASTSYIWNGSDVVYEKGTNTAYYCYGDGIISMVNANGAYYHLKNGHGDVTQLTTSSGTVADDYVYDAFGNQEDADHTIDNPFRYCGEYQDLCSGLIYLRNRYYDPSIGRFITEDPAKDGLNWYAYCGNNPVMFVDPSGLKPTPSEAADMAAHIYDSSKPLSGGWSQSYIIRGDEGLVMGVYTRQNDDYYQGIEYAIVNKGTSSWGDWVNNIQQPFGFSTDMKESILYSKSFVENHWDDEITFIGHSKGGAEAAANALAVNKNCIVFNPATVNATAYDLDVNSYTANMTAYIVEGEVLNMIFNSISVPIDERIDLIRYTWNPFVNHSMDAVKNALWVEGYN